MSHDTPPTEIYTLSLHDALPISRKGRDGTIYGNNLLMDRSILERLNRPRSTATRTATDSASDLRRSVLRNLGNLLNTRSEEHTSELQSRRDLVCRLLLEKKKNRQ